MSVFAPPRRFIEGTHRHLKDWLGLDDFAERGLRCENACGSFAC